MRAGAPRRGRWRGVLTVRVVALLLRQLLALSLLLLALEKVVSGPSVAFGHHGRLPAVGNKAGSAPEHLQGLGTIAHCPSTPNAEPRAQPAPSRQPDPGKGPWGGHTYVVVPCRPGRVELRVQLPLLPRQLVVLGLFLPRQRVPLRGETTLQTPKPLWEPQSQAGNPQIHTGDPRAMLETPNAHQKHQIHARMPGAMLETSKPHLGPQRHTENPKAGWNPQIHTADPEDLLPWAAELHSSPSQCHPGHHHLPGAPWAGNAPGLGSDPWGEVKPGGLTGPCWGIPSVPAGPGSG